MEELSPTSYASGSTLVNSPVSSSSSVSCISSKVSSSCCNMVQERSGSFGSSDAVHIKVLPVSENEMLKSPAALYSPFPTTSGSMSPIDNISPHGDSDAIIRPIPPRMISMPLQMKELMLPLGTKPYERFKDDRRDSVQLLALAPMTTSDTTVNLILECGGHETVFNLHRELLCYYSKHFRGLFPPKPVEATKKTRIRSKMLRREWRWENAGDIDSMEMNGVGDIEGKIEVDVRIKLPEAVRQIRLDTNFFGHVSHEVFSAFVAWLYRGYEAFGLDGVSEVQTDAATLIQLWVFAGKIGAPVCQNHCIEGIESWRQNSDTIETSALGWIYANTKGSPGECRLKKLLIDQCAWTIDAQWIMGEDMHSEDSFPRDALRDILGTMRRMLNTGVDTTLDPPFMRPEWRRKLYWVPVDDRRVREVLQEWK